MDVGPCLRTSQGEEPLNWRELRAWSEQTRIELTLAESRAMIRLSGEYLYWRQVGEDMMQEAPWQE